MKVTSGAKAAPSLFACLYGLGKTRKTTVGLMIPPALRPVAYLDEDRGVALRLAVLASTAEERKRLGIVEVPPRGAGPWVREQMEVFHAESARPKYEGYFAELFAFAHMLRTSPHKTVIIDSGSRICDKLLDELKHSEYGGPKRLVPQSGGLTTPSASLPDFGNAQSRFMEFLTTLNETGKHILLITHEKTGEVEDAEGVKRILAGPRAVGNALLELIPSVVDLCIRFQVQSKQELVKVKQPDGREVLTPQVTNKVVMRTTNHGFFQAGDRSGLFPDGEEVDAVTFWEKVMALIDIATERAEKA